MQTFAQGASCSTVEFGLKPNAAKSLAKEFTNLLEMNRAQEIVVSPKKRRFVVASTDASKV